MSKEDRQEKNKAIAARAAKKLLIDHWSLESVKMLVIPPLSEEEVRAIYKSAMEELDFSDFGDRA